MSQSESVSDGKEAVLRIPWRSSIISDLSSDCFMPYPEHPVLGSYNSAESQSLYSAPNQLTKQINNFFAIQISFVIKINSTQCRVYIYGKKTWQKKKCIFFLYLLNDWYHMLL